MIIEDGVIFKCRRISLSKKKKAIEEKASDKLHRNLIFSVVILVKPSIIGGRNLKDFNFTNLGQFKIQYYILL